MFQILKCKHCEFSSTEYSRIKFHYASAHTLLVRLPLYSSCSPESNKSGSSQLFSAYIQYAGVYILFTPIFAKQRIHKYDLSQLSKDYGSDLCQNRLSQTTMLLFIIVILLIIAYCLMMRLIFEYITFRLIMLIRQQHSVYCTIYYAKQTYTNCELRKPISYQYITCQSRLGNLVSVQ